MPHGIVDKQVAGIGATSLEIDSKRNSIIVFPTKILAYNKWQRNKTKLLYVGGKINDERDTTSICCCINISCLSVFCKSAFSTACPSSIQEIPCSG